MARIYVSGSGGGGGEAPVTSVDSRIGDVTLSDLYGVKAAEVPAGGTAGQVLVKDTSTDHDTSWQTPVTVQGLPTGGTTGQVLTKSSATDYDATWQSASGWATYQQQAQAAYACVLPGTTNDKTYMLGRGLSSTPTNVSPVNGYINLYPIFFPESSKTDQLTMQVASGAGGSTIRMGFYAHNTTTKLPDGLLHDLGALSTATSGQLSLSFTAITLAPGIYWFAFNTVSGPTSVIGHNTTNGLIAAPTSGPPTGTLATHSAGYYFSGNTGASLPATLTGQTLQNQHIAWIPRVMIRKAA